MSREMRADLYVNECSLLKVTATMAVQRHELPSQSSNSNVHHVWPSKSPVRALSHCVICVSLEEAMVYFPLHAHLT